MEIYKPYIFQFVSFLFLCSYFVSSLFKKTASLKKLELFVLFIILLSFLYFSRDYYIDTIDLKAYMLYYENTVTFSDVFSSKSAWKGDYLFFIWMPFGHLLSLKPVEYITVLTFVSVGLLFIAYTRFYIKDRSSLFLALFLVTCTSSFYHTSGNVLRQGLASSILILFLTSNRSIVKEAGYNFLLFYIHKGSVFGFIKYLLPRRKKYRLILFIISVLFGYFSLSIILKLPMPKFYHDKLLWYSTSFQRASNNSLLKLILLIIFNVIFFIFGKYKELKYRRAYQLFFAFSVSAALMYKIDGIFSRIVIYVDIFIPILLVGLINELSNKKDKFIAITALLILSFLYSIYVFNHSSMQINFGDSVKFF